MKRRHLLALVLGSFALLTSSIAFAAQITSEDPMLRGDTAATSQGWDVTPIFTVSELVGDYQPVGILDGVGALPQDGEGHVNVLVNHELNPGNGYAYELANGTELTGARVSAFEVQKTTLKIKDAGLAYDTIYDRRGVIVTDPAQINETGNAIDGLARLCSARSVEAGTYGFVDDIFFTGEETSKPFHPHGGTEWALDVTERTLWAAPALGRGGWENVTPLEPGDEDSVALLLGDDVESAPLYLYLGQKDALGDGSFLDRNGLAVGQLHVWVSDSGELSPQDFSGNGNALDGRFEPIDARDATMAGQAGYDSQGYKDGDTLRSEADGMGAFSFSRPEDLHDNPGDGTQAVFASTGRGGLFPADNWGTIYVVDVDVSDLSAELSILVDTDDIPVPDTGIRSPDNLTWAEDGYIYVQEDRSTSPGSLFGQVTGIEASVWQLDPNDGSYTRIAEIDRGAVAPADATDGGAGDLGNWESSGVLDVTDLFQTRKGETLLIATVQAHGIRDGSIGDNPLLDEGGQLVFLRSGGE